MIPFSEKLATLVVDGVETEINAAVYGEGAVLVLTDAFEKSPSDFTGRGREPYRAALVVRNGKIQENMTVRPALIGGDVRDDGMEHVSIRSTTPNFNHVILEGSEFTITGCDFSADTDSDGKRVCDFDGYGSVISAHRGSRLVVEDTHLYSRGVAKPVLFADGGSDCMLRNCRYECMGGTLYAGYQNAAGFTKMVAPPWVLGITGSARGVNLMGELSTLTMVNCDCTANDWGVVSTDGGHEMALYLVDSKLTLLGNGNMLGNPFVRRFGPGYGLYAAGCDEFIHGAEINVGTYAVIAIGGHINIASSRGSITPKKKYLVPTGRYEKMFDGHVAEVKDVFWQDDPLFPTITGAGKPTVINSDGWGFMFHGNAAISILDGTEVNTDYATFLIRAVSVDIDVDSSILRPRDHVLLQIIDNDDKAVGGLFTPDIYDEEGNLIQPHMGPIFNHEFFEHPGFPGIDYQTASSSGGESVNARFTNCTLEGNIFNATGYRNLGDGPRGQGTELHVTLGTGASLSGTVTASSSRHVDEHGQPKNLFTMEEYYYLGHVENVPHFNGFNPVYLILEDNAVWTPKGENRLASLTIGPDTSIKAPSGHTLAFTINGEPAEFKAGTYSGDIVISAMV